MNIALAHLRHAQVGGTERILNEVSRRLALRGHEVTILCRSHREPSHPAIRFEVLRSAVIGSAWRMWAFAGDLERHVRTHEYDLVYSLGRTWSQDVIRCSGGSHNTWVEQVQRAERGRFRLRHKLHALKDALAIKIERRSYAPGAYRKVIVNSRLVRDDLARRYAIPDDALEVIYNGVDLQRFRPRGEDEREMLRSSLGAAREEIVCLFLGTGYVRKGLDRLIEAFVEVAAREPRARLWVVGRDSEQSRYEAQASRLGLGGRVRFFGERRDPDVLFAAADLHVLPTWYDSFAFTVLESLACGTPAITTDHAGAAELIDPGLHGDVLPADCDPTQLAESLLSWCDEDRRRAARPHARARAEQHGFDATMERMLDVLEAAARDKRSQIGALDPAR